jgi:protoporphyrinogen oxidase
MRIAIVGAGISGVSAGKILKSKGRDVVIFEKASQPGGLVRCDRIGGHLFHRTGGHVFNAKDKEVLNWFWSQFDRENEFIPARRNAKIWMNGKYIGYPIENYLYQLDKSEVIKILTDVLALQAKGYRDPFSYANFSDFLVGNFGETLFKMYFKPYNDKIWHSDLTQVPLHWLEGKLPMPDYRQLLLSNLLREEEKGMVHSTFYYPKSGGSQFIVDRLSDGLEIISNCPIHAITSKAGKWLINNDQLFDRVIYTGDVRRLHSILELPDGEAANSVGLVQNLKSNGTSNILCETDDTDLSWLYLPGEETKAHRIIYTGNFSPTNNANTRKSCVVEFSGKVSEEDGIKELAALPGNLKALAYNYEPNSYVIQEKDTRVKIQDIKRTLEPMGFYLLGRFAEWEYYNMDKAIESALKLPIE